MDTQTYGRAYRVAFAITRKNHADQRIARDEAHAIGSCAAMVAEGTLLERDLKRPDETAMVAALAAARSNH